MSGRRRSALKEFIPHGSMRPMQFKVVKARYSEALKRLCFVARGERNGVTFTIVSDVPCREPKSPEEVHLAAFLKASELFQQPSASGR